MIASVLLANIQFLLVQIEGFRDFLLLREKLIQDITKAEKEALKALEEKSKPAQASGFSMAIFGTVDKVREPSL